MLGWLLLIQIGRGFRYKFINSQFEVTLQWFVIKPSSTNLHVPALGNEKALTLSKIAMRIESFRKC